MALPTVSEDPRSWPFVAGPPQSRGESRGGLRSRESVKLPEVPILRAASRGSQRGSLARSGLGSQQGDKLVTGFPSDTRGMSKASSKSGRMSASSSMPNMRSTAGSSKGFGQTRSKPEWIKPRDNLLDCFRDGREGELDVADVKRILKGLGANTMVNEKEESFGWPPLLFAADAGDVPVMKVLLDAKADTKAVCNRGNSALQVAARGGHVDAVRYLLSKKVSKDHKNKTGWTALMWASINGQTEVVATLLAAHASVQLRDESGRNACMWAARQGHADVFRVLAATGLDLRLRDRDGLTCVDHAKGNQGLRHMIKAAMRANDRLLAAARRNDVAGAEDAIESGAQVDTTDGEGGSSLLYAAQVGFVEMVQFLIKSGADTDLRDSQGFEVSAQALGEAVRHALGANRRLITAAAADDWQEAFAALESGAFVDYVDKADAQQMSALHWAALHNSADAVVKLAEKHAELEMQEHLGWTPLQVAVQRSNDKAVSALCFVKADFEVTTLAGDTLLHMAAAGNDGRMVHLLHAARAALDTPNAEGFTPVQLATVRGNTAALKALLLCGASAAVKDSGDNGVLALAVIHGKEGVVELLLPGPGGKEEKGKEEKGKVEKGKGDKAKETKAKEEKKVEKTTPSKPPPMEVIEEDDGDEDDDAASSVGDNRSVDGKAVAVSRSSSKTSQVSSVKRTPSAKSESGGPKMGRLKSTRSVKKVNSSKLPTIKEPFVAANAKALLKEAETTKKALPKKLTPPFTDAKALKQTNADGLSPLHLAVQLQQTHIVPLLVQRKADIHAPDPAGNTPLIMAAEANLVHVVEDFLELGAKDVVNKHGEKAIDVTTSDRVREVLKNFFDRQAVGKVLAKAPETKRQPAGSASTPQLQQQPALRLRLEHLPVKLTGDVLEQHIRKTCIISGVKPAKVAVALDPITQRPQGHAYVDFTRTNFITEAFQDGCQKHFGNAVRVIAEAA